ncbi:SiaB family protein kinase [Thermochromatium tepidum]|jgi:hypothetical protein|uniref:Uncharacterized protein n=1 Tax=Thermochromatium tepidum ATCC 43061 TaxID=316276 RepID=A0A6I6E4H3_THETI|nr:SiaB family protein kinase [Thermochromatium tepidum]QGU33885.1 hypothetical protein E6P07_13420 [Thermochromatium tepidum ATCC 43061]
MSIAAQYFDVHQRMRDQGVIFSFVGYVSEGILFSLGEALKQKMRLDETDANVTKRVFSIFVEQVQNLIRYSADRLQSENGTPTELSSGLVMVGRDATHFFVVCGNVVGRAEGEDLCSRLEELARMDPDTIKSYYREKLREPPEAGSRGASIGLIEIARRSTRAIEFGLTELEAERAFFCLKAYI